MSCMDIDPPISNYVAHMNKYSQERPKSLYNAFTTWAVQLNIQRKTVNSVQVYLKVVSLSLILQCIPTTQMFNCLNLLPFLTYTGSQFK